MDMRILHLGQDHDGTLRRFPWDWRLQTHQGHHDMRARAL
jgi:hypothetical protein